ncbi:Region of a membrane-bound protein predicted to be embedded in the membrane (plasmid) [Methanobacterium congolense]|uniref:Region of a membrane-bound protein predicted to be embedded in the membrane n=1 Tax=Methanobacterium congolense TaxID=118062 RepID=A0A1D3L5L9_9EURY|nr:Region of a membrane-bound protein predicted to be embedded in the membrane [Methanobacterium congolense]
MPIENILAIIGSILTIIYAIIQIILKTCFY